MATLKELLAQEQELVEKKDALSRQIAQAKHDERAGAVAEVKALMAAHGLTLADLGTRGGAGPRGLASKKVATKYRDATTGQAWSGRGLQPNWLKAFLAAGRSIDDFKV